MNTKDFLSVSDVSPEGLRRLISNAIAMKADRWSSILSGKILVLVFEKPSNRTRVSFDAGMRQLGGHCIYLSPEEVGLGKRESARDVALVLSRYANAITARTFAHETVATLAEYADIPVINALSDLEHPCQALADIMTIAEYREELRGLTVAHVGDGHNTAHSLMLACAMSGINYRIASPPGYRVQEAVLNKAQDFAAESGAEIVCTEDPQEAVLNADVLYTDVWTSMGQEEEAEKRRRIFAPYQVNDTLLSLASDDVLLMHPLPAHHGEEVAEDIIYGPQSVVFDQAENRLHAQKALLVEKLGGLEITFPD
ncbi:MAG: ornithine carbamoyltransferase [Dehalococcoidales bacterium]|nr:ornithine carbamoyltransferase [Dehalococcoidales bacterium]